VDLVRLPCSFDAVIARSHCPTEFIDSSSTWNTTLCGKITSTSLGQKQLRSRLDTVAALSQRGHALVSREAHGLEAGNVLLARLRRHPGIGRRTMHGGVRHRRVRGSGGPLSAAPAVGRLSRAEIHDSAERIAQHARNRFRYRETPEGAHAGVQRSNEQPQERRKKRGAASTCIGGVLMDAIKTTPREGISSASGQEARNGEGILREDA